jgi:hypothetical protein
MLNIQAQQQLSYYHFFFKSFCPNLFPLPVTYDKWGKKENETRQKLKQHHVYHLNGVLVLVE